MNHVSILYEIGLLHEIYKQTGRAYIANEAYRNNHLKKYLNLSIYLVSSILIAFSNFFYKLNTIIIFMIIGALTFFCYILVEEQIYNKYKSIYNSYNLKKYPYFKRSFYLQFIMFSQELDIKKIEIEKIYSVIKWEEIRKENISSIPFLTAPIYIVIITSLFALITEHLKLSNSVNGKYVVLACVFVVVITYFWWLLTDLFNTESKRNLVLCKFLKWHLLDKNITSQSN